MLPVHLRLFSPPPQFKWPANLLQSDMLAKQKWSLLSFCSPFLVFQPLIQKSVSCTYCGVLWPGEMGCTHWGESLFLLGRLPMWKALVQCGPAHPFVRLCALPEACGCRIRANSTSPRFHSPSHHLLMSIPRVGMCLLDRLPFGEEDRIPQLLCLWLCGSVNLEIMYMNACL